MVLKQKQGTEYIEEFHVGNDAELDKGWLSGWREEWIPLRYISEIRMDGAVIVLAMDTNAVSEGKLYYLKASD